MLVFGVAMLALVVTAGRAGAGAGRPSVAHTCSATDRHFIERTQVNMESLGYWSASLADGQAEPAQVIRQTKVAARSVDATRPTDPTLKQTRQILRMMLTEYWQAVSARADDRDSGVHMMRAYGLANFAHDLLAQAQPSLASKGCPIDALL